MSASAPRPAVSVLGLGLMGTALASAFLKAGHPVTVWNRSHAKTGPLAAQGATPAGKAADAVAASDLVVVCLLDNGSVREVFETLGDRVAGKTLANLTNGTPQQARELAAWAAEHGARYLDGGIMAVPHMIAGPHAYVFYSGDQEAFETYEPAFAALGGARFTGTDPGFAAVHDLALLTGMYGMYMGVLQAFALARTENIPAAGLAGPLTEWIGAMLTGIGQDAEAIDSGEHLTDVSSIAVNRAAIPNFTATFRAQGLTTAFFEPLQELLDRAAEQGHEADGLSRLVDLLDS
ncbi:NAD(P)-dependent oxidoreductase [Streptomyces jumonjinensis]|uniref:NAD(P)-dependent oxidoreductase n=1 Tax=Streptomyces jumonjinensis TaxID=1945 RepID=A0A646KLI3_STRJU|nr:NAD(P)-binding domain-containing protein [Streptomyces jumonjinensis]MQT02940.1 NAD(P)-dependent oxidoreductase [Streptomyces jumonjinensis]